MKKTCFIFIFLLGINNLFAQTNISSKHNDERVLTPAGYALKSQVHFVDKNHHLNFKDGKIQLVNTKTGLVSQEFNNNVFTESNNKTITKINSRISSADTDNGWITDAYWSNSTTKPISYFSTNWIVPNPPTTNSGQTIFLFNGLCPPANDWILQPVLQWGPSAAGGGNYWAIANWYVDDTIYFCDSLTYVSPGVNLQGIMKLTSHSGSNYSYSSSFVVDSSGTIMPGDSLQINNVVKLTYAYQTLEVYGVTQCTDYPADTMVRMTNIVIKTDSVYPSFMWTPQNFVYEYGQNTTIVSNSSTNGEVDIYFHSPCVPTGIADITANTGEINVYPNPATESIKVISNQYSVNSIEIYNLLGENIYSLPIATNLSPIIINIGDIPSGVYFIKIETDKGVESRKFIKE